MATTHPINLKGKNFPELIIPDHKVKPKLKAQTYFVIKSVVLCPSLYIYHDEVRIDDLMEEFTENFGLYTYGRIFQVNNVHKYIIKYNIEYDISEAARDQIYFCDLCTEFPRIAPVKIF